MRRNSCTRRSLLRICRRQSLSNYPVSFYATIGITCNFAVVPNLMVFRNSFSSRAVNTGTCLLLCDFLPLYLCRQRDFSRFYSSCSMFFVRQFNHSSQLFSNGRYIFHLLVVFPPLTLCSFSTYIIWHLLISSWTFDRAIL